MGSAVSGHEPDRETPPTARVLLIDDNPDDRVLVERQLRAALPHLSVVSVGTAEDLDGAIAAGFDAAITDFRLRFSDGIEVLKRLKAAAPKAPVIMFTASGSEEVATAALKQGLDDYITKTPKHYPRIPLALAAALERAHQRVELAHGAALLEAGSRRFDSVLDASPLALTLFAPVRDESGVLVGFRCSYANRAAAEVFGSVVSRSPGPMLDDMLLPGWDARALFTCFREALEDGRTSRVESTSEGGAHHLNIQAPCPDGVLMWSVDVTAQKQAEELLRKREADLRDADRRKDDFLATLAHELRNPVAPIRFAAAMLRAGVEDDSVRHARSVIERQADHLARLLDDLLDVNRITRNLIELRLERLDLRDIAQEAVETARPIAVDGQHDLVFIASPTPAWIRADRTRILQIVGNLLNNAIRYTPPGGRIEVEVHSDRGTSNVSVRDTGVGVGPDMLPHIFDLFGRPRGALASSKGGLGLGLTLAKQLVELHGGSIEAKSEGLGRGSEFVVRLPAEAAAAETSHQLADSPAGVSPLGDVQRILVVDDNVDAAETLALLLGLHGAETRVAHDGASALSVAEEIRPEVVVLDLGLPDVDGTDVARELRRRAWARDVRIIALTGWGQPEDRERTREAGMDAHLVKPIDPARLVNVIASFSADPTTEEAGRH